MRILIVSVGFGLASPAHAASGLSLMPRATSGGTLDPFASSEQIEDFDHATVDRLDDIEAIDDTGWQDRDDELDWLEPLDDEAWEPLPPRARPAPTLSVPAIAPRHAPTLHDPPDAVPPECGRVGCERLRRRGQIVLGSGIVIAAGGVAMLVAGVHGLATKGSHGLALTIASPHPLWIGSTIAAGGGSLIHRADQEARGRVSFELRGGGFQLRF
jgi:hypothetical protein